MCGEWGRRLWPSLAFCGSGPFGFHVCVPQSCRRDQAASIVVFAEAGINQTKYLPAREVRRARVAAFRVLFLCDKEEVRPGYGDRLYSASDLTWGSQFARDALMQILRLVAMSHCVVVGSMALCSFLGDS